MRLLRVQDEESGFSEQIETKMDANLDRIRDIVRQDDENARLMAGDAEIAAVCETLLDGSGPCDELVLDITSLPKRFFFLMTKLAMQRPTVGTIVVAYCQPMTAGYTYQQLAANPEPVRAIPGYGPMNGESEMLVVGLGFEPLGLPRLIEDYRDETRSIRILMPFPPGQPYSRRIWRFLQRLGVDTKGDTVYRVNALDAFESYAQIGSFASEIDEDAPPTLAPYGPKPMSLGMCLYALKNKASVMYTQPTVYNPDYTKGVGPAWGYCIRHGSRDTF